MEPRHLICLSQDYVVQVTSFQLSIDDQQGLSPEWLIKGNDGCGIVPVRMLSVEKMHVASLGSMSIIEIKTNDDLPRLVPCCTNCITPDRVEANRTTIFSMWSRSAVGHCAFISTSFWYVTDSVPRPFPRGT